MKKLILVGRSEAGKTTLTQVLRGLEIKYEKTQYINYHSALIDTPGEYAENRELGRALALYSYEADICGLLVSATEPYCLFPPNVTPMANREVIGIITKIDHPDARPDLAKLWLEIAGCKKIFHTSAKTGQGIDELLEYLNE
ncbi:MAG: EutP/PduV family microcompartment system protein [Clostridia bacterium]|nr:EutP/PduV family microcompartment system protein [Clostridia bacterium]